MATAGCCVSLRPPLEALVDSLLTLKAQPSHLSDTREWNRNFSRAAAHLDPHEPWNYRSVRRLTAPSLRANCPAPAGGSSMGNLCWADSTVVLPVDGVDRYLHQPQLQPSDQAPPSVDYVSALVACQTLPQTQCL